MASDPYKYFRIESRELIDSLVQGVLQLEKGATIAELAPRLLRFAHTLKGAARVVKQSEIAERAHAIEAALTAQRDAGGALSATQASDLLRLLDEMSAQVKGLGDPAAGKPVATTASPPRVAPEEPLETLRVEIHAMDDVLRSITEVGVQVSALRRTIATVDQTRDLESLRGVQRTLITELGRVSSELGDVQDAAHRLRLTAARTIFPALDRAVRDAAQTLGREAMFEPSGGDVRLDAGILLSLRDALGHVVRNAVAHGIETPAQRAAAGKPAAGRIRLDVERRGSGVAFVCTDDGRGIDVDAVRRAAVASGRLTHEEAHSLSVDGVVALLYTGGLTTASQVSELAGRGIGLDVARATVAQLKGELRIRSTADQGTTIELVVPISIASMRGLVVESSGRRVAFPLDVVRQTLRVSDAEVARATDADSIVYEGRSIPFVPLDRLLRYAPSPTRRRIWSAVVINAGERTVAVGVERLHGTSTMVVRSLPALVNADPVVFGAASDADGNPQLVLDAYGLVAAVDRAGGAPIASPETGRPPILVIDDSLTTRMLEQSILQSAGYEVDLAIHAEDGIEKARHRHYGLFIVDVEMPGMTGFEFVAHTRDDVELRKTPAILVTSLNAPDDRRRGEESGASAYIVKGEFDQDVLLRAVRRLLG